VIHRSVACLRERRAVALVEPLLAFSDPKGERRRFGGVALDLLLAKMRVVAVQLY
jgi:hypothetical protein